MCRSIKTLRGDETVTDVEVYAAALQFVRKISGYRAPSKRNAEAFDTAVAEITASAEFWVIDRKRSSLSLREASALRRAARIFNRISARTIIKREINPYTIIKNSRYSFRAAKAVLVGC